MEELVLCPNLHAHGSPFVDNFSWIWHHHAIVISEEVAGEWAILELVGDLWGLRDRGGIKAKLISEALDGALWVD